MTAKLIGNGCAPLNLNRCPDNTDLRNVYYEYDIRNLQLAARFTSATGLDAVTSEYDPFGRQTASTIRMAGRTRRLEYGYDDAGNRTTIEHPDGQVFRYGYDARGQMLRVADTNDSVLTTFTYDAVGKRLSVFGGKRLYQYDDAGRLTSLSTAAGQAHDTASTYAYTPAGQVRQATRSNDLYAFGGYVTATRAYTVNRLNQYTQAGSVAFAHDANGNLSDEGSIDYTYDGENRLVGDNQGNAITYDPLGRLYSTSWLDGGVTRTTTFLYDGDELVGEYEGATQTARYVHGPGTDEPVVWYTSGATGQADRRFLYADRQGSIELVTYNGGAAMGINSYDEYGIPAAGNAGRFGYTGQIWLPNFGLSYYKARMYSPTTGRFLQVDPVGYDDQVNLYAYVGSDPVNKTDPTGRDGACIYSSGCSPKGATLGEVIWGSIRNDPGVILDVAMIIGDIAIGGPTGEAAIGIAARRGSREVARATTRREAGIVYRRVDRNNPGGKCYIGRCNSQKNFERRQRDHGRANPEADYDFQIVDRARPGQRFREAEQRQIDRHGGPTNKSNPNGGTENKRNEIGFCRGTRIGNSDGGGIC